MIKLLYIKNKDASKIIVNRECKFHFISQFYEIKLNLKFIF